MTWWDWNKIKCLNTSLMVVKFMQGHMRCAHMPQPWCWFVWACMQRDHLFSFYLFIYCRLFFPFFVSVFSVNFWLRYQWGTSDCCGSYAARHWHGHQDPQVRLGEFQGWGKPSAPPAPGNNWWPAAAFTPP